MKADSSLDFIFLLVGPILVFAFAHIARGGTFLFYQRFLEAVSMRAKVEQALGLTDPTTFPARDSGYWPGEAFVAPRFLRARQGSDTSQEFVDARKTTGYQKATLHLFLTFQVIAGGIAVALLIAAYLFDSPMKRVETTPKQAVSTTEVEHRADNDSPTAAEGKGTHPASASSFDSSPDEQSLEEPAADQVEKGES